MLLRSVCVALLIAARLTAQGAALAAATRLVGVYDDSTGAPLAGVEVGFVGTDLLVRTGSGGIAVIPRFGHSAAILQARLLGYAPVMHAVQTNDTTPVTIVLRHSAQTLPAVEVKGEKETFYTRRFAEAVARHRQSGAAADALITSEDIRKRGAIRLTDAFPRSNLGMGCKPLKSVVYVNGMEVSNDPTRKRFGFKDNPIDENDVSSVDFMEVYRHVAEYPAQFNKTRSADQTTCIILIWLK